MKRMWLVAVLFFGVSLLFGMDHYYRAQEEKKLNQELEQATELTKRRITQAFSLRLNAVEDLKAFLLASPVLPDRESFDRYAARSLEQYPTVSAFQYSDADWIIRYVYPLKTNEASLNHDLKTRLDQIPDLAKTQKERKTVTSNPFRSIQGKLAIIVRAPLYVGDEFRGFAQELFDVNLTAAEMFDDLASDYAIELRDANGNVFWQNGGEAAGAHTSVSIPIGDNSWRADIRQRQAFHPSPYVRGVIWGFGLTALFFMLLLLEQQLRREQALRQAVQEKTLSLAEKNRSLLLEIEERSRAQESLRLSEEKYEKVFRNLAEVVGLVQLPERKIIELNDAFYQLLEYSPEQTIHHSTMEFGLWVYETEREALYEMLARGETVRKMECHWRTQSGKIRCGLLSADVLILAGGSCLLCVWNDISERKQAEAELLAAKQELEVRVESRTQDLLAINKKLQSLNLELQRNMENLHQTQEQLLQSEKMASLGRLVAGIAHEINTPMGVALTASSHLQKMSCDIQGLVDERQLRRQDFEYYIAEVREASAMVQTNLERAAHLVRSFKQVSADQTSELRRVIRLGEYIEEILFSLHPKLKRTGHAVTVDCPADLQWDGYPGALAQVITNLVMNSLVHAYGADEAGIMKIEVRQETNDFLLLYSDDGKGMSPTVRQQIFDPFFTTNRSQGGTGLGLYLVYNIVSRQFGGSIRCESEAGSGSRFFIRIPLVAPTKVMIDSGQRMQQIDKDDS